MVSFNLLVVWLFLLHVLKCSVILFNWFVSPFSNRSWESRFSRLYVALLKESQKIGVFFLCIPLCKAYMVFSGPSRLNMKKYFSRSRVSNIFPTCRYLRCKHLSNPFSIRSLVLNNEWQYSTLRTTSISIIILWFLKGICMVVFPTPKPPLLMGGIQYEKFSFYTCRITFHMRGIGTGSTVF